MPRYAIVEAPSALGHVPEHMGVQRAPEVLLGAGLADGLAARRAGRVEAAGYSAERDPQTKVMNPQAINDYSPLLASLLTATRSRLGAGAAAIEAVRYLTRAGGPEDGFWIHLDADVFDETIMQAVDDPRPDGLAWDEVVSALSVAMRSRRAIGLQVAIYNPDIDTDGSNGRGLAATVREA